MEDSQLFSAGLPDMGVLVIKFGHDTGRHAGGFGSKRQWRHAPSTTAERTGLFRTGSK